MVAARKHESTEWNSRRGTEPDMDVGPAPLMVQTPSSMPAMFVGIEMVGSPEAKDSQK